MSKQNVMESLKKRPRKITETNNPTIAIHLMRATIVVIKHYVAKTYLV